MPNTNRNAVWRVWQQKMILRHMIFEAKIIEKRLLPVVLTSYHCSYPLAYSFEGITKPRIHKHYLMIIGRFYLRVEQIFSADFFIEIQDICNSDFRSKIEGFERRREPRMSRVESPQPTRSGPSAGAVPTALDAP